MLKLQELLGHYVREEQTIEVLNNLNILLEKANKVRTLWGKPWTVTSGLRTLEDQIRIYKEKGITDPKKIPKKSKHLYGQAVDIYDPGLKITKWLKKNPQILIDADLYCEEGNKNWVHFQSVPPKSGDRWFNP